MSDQIPRFPAHIAVAGTKKAWEIASFHLTEAEKAPLARELAEFFSAEVDSHEEEG